LYQKGATPSNHQPHGRRSSVGKKFAEKIESASEGDLGHTKNN
jgi:hypothetical protein